ncbi:MAG: glutathione S-transferase family protein [Alphaproteobacteria bacterium]
MRRGHRHGDLTAVPAYHPTRSDDMILVHHLRIGRAVFTVWLLEEMGLDYELKIYLRDETGRAQDDLKQAHPLGKSPVIEDGDLTLAESGAIAAYLLDRYDTDARFAPPRSDVKAYAIFTQWLHYPEGSAFAPLLMMLLLSREQAPKPPVIEAFAKSEVDRQLAYIQGQIGDKPFLLGDRIQAPDIGVTYVVHLARRLGALEGYPVLGAYLDRQLARPAFQRACERSGERVT